MVIREAGLIFRGFTLINAKYHTTSKGDIDQDLRSGLITAIINFAESAFLQQSLEYFKGNKFIISFTQDKMKSLDSHEPELLIAYAILDKHNKIDKHIHKVIVPLLKKVIERFKKKNAEKNLSEISQFRDFKKDLDEIFGSNTKTLDQRLDGVFF